MQLTATEYSKQYSRLLKKFAVNQQKAWEEMVYHTRSGYNHRSGKLLFLFCYALSTWEHSDSADNYLTETQVMLLISKANTLG